MALVVKIAFVFVSHLFVRLEINHDLLPTLAGKQDYNSNTLK